LEEKKGKLIMSVRGERPYANRGVKRGGSPETKGEPIGTGGAFTHRPIKWGYIAENLGEKGDAMLQTLVSRK